MSVNKVEDLEVLCPDCGGELLQLHYAAGVPLFLPVKGLYFCTNSIKFKSIEDCMELLELTEDELDHFCYQEGVRSWQELRCESKDNAMPGVWYRHPNGSITQSF